MICVDSFGDVTWGPSVVSAFTCISTKYQHSPFTLSASWLAIVSILGPGPCIVLVDSSLTYCSLLDVLEFLFFLEHLLELWFACTWHVSSATPPIPNLAFLFFYLFLLLLQTLPHLTIEVLSTSFHKDLNDKRNF